MSSAAAASAPGAAAAAAVGGWSREEEKSFENALASLLPIKEEEEEDGKRWEEVAARVPGKTAAEVRRHYEVLVEDVHAIEAGKVLIPVYVGEEKESSKEKENKEHHHGGLGDRRPGGCGGSGGGGGGGGVDSGGHGKGGSKSDQERRKGIPWTEEEHKLFLLGLDKFGKGDWRSISRNFVISRTPTQVASHAQKYFIRLNSMNRDRRRSSIHDITRVNDGELSTPQGPITGHTNAAGAGAVGPPPPVKHPSQPSIMPGMGMYGPPVGRPVTGHMVSALGTPVMLSPGHSPYVMPVAYPVPQPTMHP